MYHGLSHRKEAQFIYFYFTTLKTAILYQDTAVPEQLEGAAIWKSVGGGFLTLTETTVFTEYSSF